MCILNSKELTPLGGIIFSKIIAKYSPLFRVTNIMPLAEAEVPPVLDLKSANANKGHANYERTHQLLQGNINGFYHLRTANPKQNGHISVSVNSRL